MSKQRKRHWLVVISEEAEKAFKRGIPHETRFVWEDYDAAMAYRGKEAKTKGRILSSQTILLRGKPNEANL